MSMAEGIVLGWHWVRAERRLLDGQPVEQGRTYRMDGKPVLCERGFHASERIIDALGYAPGNVLCRVQLGGVIVRDTDKLVATERTVLWMADVAPTLHEFACMVATDALDLLQSRGWPVAEASRAAIVAKRQWLRGELDIESLAAAAAAAAAEAAAAQHSCSSACTSPSAQPPRSPTRPADSH